MCFETTVNIASMTSQNRAAFLSKEAIEKYLEAQPTNYFCARVSDSISYSCSNSVRFDSFTYAVMSRNGSGLTVRPRM